MGSLYQLLPLVLLILIMYFLLIRPQKKKERAVNEMRSNIKVGDEIITIGGICGKVVKVKEETIVIQVGAEKLKFEMMKWSVSKVVNSDESKTSPKKARPVDEAEEAPKKALPKRLKKDSGEQTDTDSHVSEESAQESAVIEESEEK
ncbi:MAG: preprotein translocase subunit YajC [Clostridiales bacterium]|uniref:preprotein translocase subunit YajC n=1 Tax=Aminipila sp. TaxID=2060095 RepID=UPI001DEC218C|nr:preprotein translocase subunit YajC [Aminipila sp.]MBE6033832.1 preprotein translocase subunit YajC [Clostridiales bacterium]